MKKFTITALAAVAAVMMYASCDNGAPKALLLLQQLLPS